jgi:hypothetical protein
MNSSTETGPQDFNTEELEPFKDIKNVICTPAFKEQKKFSAISF